MEITERKYRFIEKFIKIVNPEKIQRFEELLNSEITNDDEIVAHTIKGQPISRKKYIENNKEAIEAFKRGEFKTQSEIKQKYSS